MTVFWRYWLLQVPGWGVLGAVLWVSHHYFGLSWLWCGVLFGVWVLKDWAIYPILKKHYEFRHEGATESLLGQRAIAEEVLEPRGYVRLRGELWRAELQEGSAPIPRGGEVVVDTIEGLTLRVRPKSG